MSFGSCPRPCPRPTVSAFSTCPIMAAGWISSTATIRDSDVSQGRGVNQFTKWLLVQQEVGRWVRVYEVDIGPAGSRAMDVRARAGSRCARVSSTYT